MSAATMRRRPYRKASLPPRRPAEPPAWAEKRARALAEIESIKAEIAALQRADYGAVLEVKMVDAYGLLQEADQERRREVAAQEAAIQARFEELKVAANRVPMASAEMPDPLRWADEARREVQGRLTAGDQIK